MKKNLILCGLFLLAACGRQPSPQAVVEAMFAAFQAGDGAGVTEWLSQQGRGNATVWCSGAAITCLRANYPEAAMGTLAAHEVSVIEETADEALIRLHTTWSEGGGWCQVYDLDQTEAGWRVTFFNVPERCQ